MKGGKKGKFTTQYDEFKLKTTMQYLYVFIRAINELFYDKY
jgi:hypothetical protein